MRRLKQAIISLRGRSRTPSRPPADPARHALWSIGIFGGPSPLELAPLADITNPVVTRDSLTDVSASFVADPFLFQVGNGWHLYYELLNRANGRGEIALSTSADLKTWTYEGVVLAEPFHLSYPLVFEWEGERYMIPEANQTRSVRLYKATEFPHRWTHVHTLLSDDRYADSTIFRHENRWWLFTQTSPLGKNDNLRLFYADSLFDEWTEHPLSPLVENDVHGARPAGRVIRHGDHLLRFAQDCASRYGLRVFAFEITTLTPTEYAERPASTNPVATGSGSGWNASRMHHVDAHQLPDGNWIAAVDGAYNTTKANINGTA